MKTEMLQIEITKSERRALNRYAEQDMREPAQFVRWLLRTEFERRRSQQPQPAVNSPATPSPQAG